MKRLSVLLLAVLAVSVLAACGASPRARADEFAQLVPVKVGDWERDSGDDVKLLNNTITSHGHIIMTYAGPDDALAYLVIQAFGGPDGAEVAATERLRDLRLRGLVFDRDRQPRQATAEVAQDGRARYALFQAGEYFVELDTLAASEDTPVSDEAFDSLITATRAAFSRLVNIK